MIHVSNILNRYFILIYLIIISNFAQAQNSYKKEKDYIEISKETPVPLCCHADAYYYEYSSIAIWENKILLIPQRPEEKRVSQNEITKDTSVKIIAIDAEDIKTELYHTATKIYKIDISNISVLHSIKTYEGIEGAVVPYNTNSIYLSIETNVNDKNCYIIKGSIDKTTLSIKLDENVSPLPLPKPAGYVDNDNAGFESISYLPKQNKLIAFFERNRNAKDDRAIIVDTSLNQSTVQYLKFAKPLLFRLTDVTHLTNSDELYGINHHYKGDKKEFKYYIGSSNRDINEAKNQMFNQDPENFSFTRVIKLFITPKNEIDWAEVKTVSFSDDNWEGILPFRDGVLMVVDGVPPGQPCKLSYFKLN